MLHKHYEKLTLNQPNLRILIPLCGKSFDLLWLSSNGHQVVGVEFAADVIVQFFDENKIKYNIKQIDSEFKLYEVNDKS